MLAAASLAVTAANLDACEADGVMSPADRSSLAAFAAYCGPYGGTRCVCNCIFLVVLVLWHRTLEGLEVLQWCCVKFIWAPCICESKPLFM